MKDATGRQRYVETGELVFPGMEPAPPEPPKFTEQQSLRKEYQTLSGDWITVRDRYEQITEAPETGAGDTARIIGLMKMFDPTSVVQPGEAATAANAAGVPEMIRSLWNSYRGEGRLSPEARRQIEQAAKTVYRQQGRKQLAREADFRALAEGRGWKPETIVRDIIGEKGRELITTPVETRATAFESTETVVPNPMIPPGRRRPTMGLAWPEQVPNQDLGPATPEVQSVLDKYLP